jgi:L-ascorbate metabolism protein UlaG (beta-lactamase superfamily)
MLRTLLFLAVLLVAPASFAQNIQDNGANSIPCGLGLVQGAAKFQPAAAETTGVPTGSIRVTFVGHATFLLETPEGASLATDYNGMNRPRYLPDIVTMNNFHITHYTNSPDPEIKYVLRGWDPAGGIARHNLKFKDLHVYSVPTNIEYLGMGPNGGPTNGNSVFVFEAANVCVAALSHLHHDLTPEEVAALGRIDVLIVPVDGFVTMSHEEVMHIIDLVKPRVVIPCHYDLFGGPATFLARIKGKYPLKVSEGDSTEISQATLPQQTEVWMLQDGGGGRRRGFGGGGGFGPGGGEPF